MTALICQSENYLSSPPPHLILHSMYKRNQINRWRNEGFFFDFEKKHYLFKISQPPPPKKKILNTPEHFSTSPQKIST